MGICKCRKRSDLFCYHCDKAVCFDCITEPTHKLGKVTTYCDWLMNPVNTIPVCPLSGVSLTESDDVIRFMNLQIFLLEAINGYGSSKPNNTALAGFTIPGTEEPMVPPFEDQSKLAQQIREKLSKFPWISELISLQRETPETTVHRDINAGKLDIPPVLQITGKKPTPADDYTTTPPQQSGIASRKTTSTNQTNEHIHIDLNSHLNSHLRPDDDPEYKYRPKPIRKVFEALGFLSTATMSKAQHYQVNGKRAIFVFALLFTLSMVFFMGMSLTESALSEVQSTIPAIDKPVLEQI